MLPHTSRDFCRIPRVLYSSCILGVVNRLYDHLIPTIAQNWAKACGLARSKMHGGEFNGNQAVKLLNSLPKLQDISQDSETVKTIKALESFERVRKSCFGLRTDDKYVQFIEEFKNSYSTFRVIFKHCA